MSELPLFVTDRGHPNLEVSYFGYELIRDILLPDILGKDAAEILYWAGKKLARSYPLTDIDAVIAFFNEANWGNLSIKDEKRRELVLELTGNIVSTRLKRDKKATFQLEAGFLAQQLEMQKQVTVETFEHPHKKIDKIQFTIKWDSKDPILPK